MSTRPGGTTRPQGSGLPDLEQLEARGLLSGVLDSASLSVVDPALTVATPALQAMPEPLASTIDAAIAPTVAVTGPTAPVDPIPVSTPMPVVQPPETPLGSVTPTAAPVSSIPSPSVPSDPTTLVTTVSEQAPAASAVVPVAQPVVPAASISPPAVVPVATGVALASEAPASTLAETPVEAVIVPRASSGTRQAAPPASPAIVPTVPVAVPSPPAAVPDAGSVAEVATSTPPTVLTGADPGKGGSAGKPVVSNPAGPTPEATPTQGQAVEQIVSDTVGVDTPGTTVVPAVTSPTVDAPAGVANLGAGAPSGQDGSAPRGLAVAQPPSQDRSGGQIGLADVPSGAENPAGLAGGPSVPRASPWYSDSPETRVTLGSRGQVPSFLRAAEPWARADVSRPVAPASIDVGTAAEAAPEPDVHLADLSSFDRAAWDRAVGQFLDQMESLEEELARDQLGAEVVAWFLGMLFLATAAEVARREWLRPQPGTAPASLLLALDVPE